MDPIKRILLTLALIAIGVVPAGSRQPLRLPKVDILYTPYGTIFDKTCGTFLKNDSVTPDLVSAAGKLRPELEREWAREGPQYLAVALNEIGAPCPYDKMQASLTVCPVGTMSTQLIVNVRQYLPNAAHPAPAGDFSEKLFHELMHHYVSAIVAESSLRRKYTAEPPVVLNHLHVMALEKLVLLKLGKGSELRFLDEEYRTDPPPGNYRRAWEIVSGIEGYEAFIKDLRNSVRNGARPTPGMR